MLKRIAVFALVFCFFIGGFKTHGLGVSAKSAILIDGISGRVIYCVNERQRLPMASTTKIMTALLLCENGEFDKEITVTPEMIRTEGSSMGLTVGMKLTHRDLLYGMLLTSGNDAANATAVSIGGSIEDFVAMMNDRAEELGLADTHFETPSGLDGETHYTTAYDLAMLTRYALANDEFAKACQTKSITLNYGGTSHTLTNHNRLLSSYEGAVGVKTGFTKKSGRCLVSAARHDNALLIAVTLNDGNDWQDHKAMLDYGFTFICDNPVLFKETNYSISVLGGEKETVTAKSEEISFRTHKESIVTKKEYIYPFVYAPIQKGDTVGYIEYYSGDFLVDRQEIIAQENANAVLPPTFWQRVKISFCMLFKLI